MCQDCAKCRRFREIRLIPGPERDPHIFPRKKNKILCFLHVFFPFALPGHFVKVWKSSLILLYWEEPLISGKISTMGKGRTRENKSGATWFQMDFPLETLLPVKKKSFEVLDFILESWHSLNPTFIIFVHVFSKHVRLTIKKVSCLSERSKKWVNNTSVIHKYISLSVFKLWQVMLATAETGLQNTKGQEIKIWAVTQNRNMVEGDFI